MYNVWFNKIFSLKCVDAFFPGLMWLFHHHVYFHMFLMFVVSNKVCVHWKWTRECDRYMHGSRNLSLVYPPFLFYHIIPSLFSTQCIHGFLIVFTLILILLIGCQNGCVRGWWRWSSYFQYGGWCVFHCTEGCQVRKHNLQILSWKYQSILWHNTVKVESSCSGLWFDLAFNRTLICFFEAADHCA